MICSSCGTPYADGMPACPGCGAPAPQAAQGNAQYAQGAYQTAQQPYYAPGQSFTPPYVAPPVNEEPVSVKEWIIVALISILPTVNIVMLFVWAFGSNTKKSKSNYAKATLIFSAIGIVLSILFFVLMFSIFGAEMFSSAMRT